MVTRGKSQAEITSTTRGRKRKMGVDEEIFVVDLKKGAVSTGPSFPRRSIRLVWVLNFGFLGRVS